MLESKSIRVVYSAGPMPFGALPVPKNLSAIFLCLLAVPVFAAAPQAFNAATTGELVVDADGRVVSVELDHKQLGAKAMDAFEQRILSWRFEPVIVDGRAVPARARVHLDMLAKAMPGTEGLQLEIRQAWFSEPPDAKKPKEFGEEAAVDSSTDGDSGLSPPQYPLAPLMEGAGGTVWLLVRVGADGEVTEVGTRAAELRTVFTFTPRRQKHHMRAFALAAEQAAKGWKLPGCKNMVVIVPVKFVMPGDDGRKWVRVQEVELETPVFGANDEAVLRLSESGDSGSDRFRLLTALN